MSMPMPQLYQLPHRDPCRADCRYGVIVIPGLDYTKSPPSGGSLQGNDDNTFVSKCCKDFELLGVQVPIVSAYETVESRVHQGVFKTERTIIASQERATVKSKHEIVIPINKAHDGICYVQIRGPLYKAIENALQRSLEDAPGLIYKKFHTSTRDGGDWGTIQIITTDNERIQAVLIPTLKSLDTSAESSRGATFGSSVHPSQRVDQTITNFDDILDLIDKNLLPEHRRNVNFGEGSLRSFALCGMDGIGKTQIAVEYAYSRRPQFDAIFFVTVDGKAVLSEDLARIDQQLGLEDEREANNLTVSIEIVKGWLLNPVRSYDAPPSAANEVFWLLIFDNVNDLDVLEEFWPTTGSGAVLITSRDSLAKNQIHTANNGVN
ncbi:hypothetical protein CIB48_g5721 [Xylaria polymorpha]|nr:hypothetical protein CIB48_g5721 [Xylaria polymorpha]